MTVSTTVRLDPSLKKAVEKRAKALGMDFSEVARILFASFSIGDIQIGAVQYPASYAAMIQKEHFKLKSQRNKGRANLYTSADDLFGEALGK